jgi:hypothetical protein
MAILLSDSAGIRTVGFAEGCHAATGRFKCAKRKMMNEGGQSWLEQDFR